MKRIGKIIRLLVLPVAFGAFGLLLLINNQDRFVPAGELRFQEESIDFGEVPDWKGKVTQSITAQNTGRGKVVIQRI